MARTVDRSMWVGVGTAPAAWAAHGLLGWFIGSQICTALMPTTVRLMVVGLTLVCLAAALTGAAISWRRWGALRAADSPLATQAESRDEFVALAGLLISVVFAIAIFWGGWASAFISNCGRMR